MEGRDKKGRFTKGHRCNLTREQQRKGGLVSKQDRVQKWIDAIDGTGAQPVTKEEAATIDRYLLGLTDESLKELVERTDVPIIIKARARQLLSNPDSFEAIEKILDRAFGRPKQSEEVQIAETQTIVSFPELVKQLGIGEVTMEELYED